MTIALAARTLAVAATLTVLVGASACARYDSDAPSGPPPSDAVPTAAGPPASDAGSVPAALTVPANHRLVVAMTVQRGPQVYRCADSSWTLREPDAVLTSSTTDALHTAGPRWIATVDGSAVTGAQVASAPVTDAVPALLLRATAHQGVGLFGTVDFVQRLATRGGQPPTGSCSPGQEKAVDYSAEYRFWAPGGPSS